MIKFHIPALCDSCGFVFPSPLAFEDCRFIAITGGGNTTCPLCGSKADIINATYDFQEDKMLLLKGPEITFTRLSELNRAITNLDVTGFTLEQVVDEIQKQTPELSGAVKFFRKTIKDPHKLIVALTSLIVAYTAIHQTFIKEEKPSVTNNYFDHSTQNHIELKIDSHDQIINIEKERTSKEANSIKGQIDKKDSTSQNSKER